MQIEPKHTYSVDELEVADAYKLATSLVVPRPIGWIGTRSESGGTNLAPYSFFNIVAAYPPTFVVAPAVTGRRDTLTNIEANGQFTVNIVSEETVEAMNLSSGSYPPDQSEFDICGLTEVDAETIDAPLVGEAIANFECTATQLVPVGTGMLVIGVASRVHVAERVVGDNFHIAQSEIHAIGRHAGGMYSRTSSTLFNIDRPQ